MANSNGWGDGAANNTIGWGQGANNSIGWGSSHATSWAGLTDIVGITTDPAASAYFTATGITGVTQQDAINNLVKGLKTDGIWSKMKAVYPFVTDNRNLLGYTEDFGNAYWTKQHATVSTNTTTAPDGTLTADTSLFSSILPSFVRASTIPITSGQTYTISVYVKKSASSGADNIRITTNDTSAWNTGISQKFPLTTSWQRITLTGVINSSLNVSHIIFGSTNVDGTVDNTCGGNVDIWGAQLELGSTATTYQPIATTQQAFISSQFKFNLVNPVDSDAAFRLVFNGGWTHSSNGATPNGTNGYADTKFNANTNQSVNNFALSVYLRTANTNATVDMGAANSPTYLPLTSIEGSVIGRTQYCWDFTTNKVDIATADSKGMWGVSRTGATTWQSFQRNTAVAKTTTTSQTTLPNLNIYVGASSINTGASAFSNRELSFAQLSNGLTNTEFNNLYTRVQAFQTSLSRQV